MTPQIKPHAVFTAGINGQSSVDVTIMQKDFKDHI